VHLPYLCAALAVYPSAGQPSQLQQTPPMALSLLYPEASGVVVESCGQAMTSGASTLFSTVPSVFSDKVSSF
jgi:hypothetical protein